MHTIVLVCIIIAVLNTDSGAYRSTLELKSGVAREYACDFDERIEKMNELSENEVLFTKPLAHSNVLYFDDVTDDISNWRNESWKAFYGHDIIIIED